VPMPVIRIAWGDFPNVAVQAKRSVLGRYPSLAETYSCAQNGNAEAARAVVNRLYRPATVSAFAGEKIDFVVPVLLSNQANALASELAHFVALGLGAEVVRCITQDHTMPNLDPEILALPSFQGPVPPGRYVIVDDMVTLGSSIADLRGWITANGGTVAFATSLFAAHGASKLCPQSADVAALKSRVKMQALEQVIPFPLEYLTARETDWLKTFAWSKCPKPKTIHSTVSTPVLPNHMGHSTFRDCHGFLVCGC